MDLIPIFALVFAVIGLLGTIATASFFLLKSPDYQVRGELRQVQEDISDLHDRLHQWMRRDSTRRARQAKEDKAYSRAPDAPIDAPVDRAAHKASLRQRLRSIQGQ